MFRHRILSNNRAGSDAGRARRAPKHRRVTLGRPSGIVPRAGAVPLLVTVVLLASCGAGADAHHGEAVSVGSPIERLLGIESDPVAAAQQGLESERRVAEHTARCMLDRGFVYTAVVAEQASVAAPGDSGEPAVNSREWIERYGFGITTQRFSQRELGPELVGYLEAPPVEAPVDPNAELLASMGEGERAAWQASLYGEPGGMVDGTPVEGRRGCLELAAEAVLDTERITRFHEEFADQLVALDEAVAADPRVVRHRDEVARCVRERGWSWSPDEQPYTRFGAAVEALADDSGGLDPAKRPALAALQSDEIALAIAIDDCGGGPLDEQEFMSSIRNQYEQEFVERNRSRLQAYAR